MTFAEIYYKVWMFSNAEFERTYNIPRGQMSRWINGSMPNDENKRLLYLALKELDYSIPYPSNWIKVDIEEDGVFVPKTEFQTLEELFNYLGVKVRIDERAYYMYTLESHDEIVPPLRFNTKDDES